MYFVIKHKKTPKYQLLRSNESITTVSTLYQAFYKDGVTVNAVKYVSPFFMDTLFINKNCNVYTYTCFELEKQYALWTYSKTKNLCNDSFKTIRSYCSQFISRIANRYNIFEEFTEPIPSIDDADLPVGTSQSSSSISSSDHAHESTPSTSTFETEPEIVPLPPSDFETFKRESVFKVKKNKFPSVFETFDDKEGQEILLTTNYIPENGITFIIFEVKETNNTYKQCTFLDTNYISYLSKLKEFGIDNISIQTFLVFPSSPVLSGLIEYFDLFGKWEKGQHSNFIESAYRIYKIVQNKPYKGVLIKALAEHIFSNYTHSLNSQISISEMYDAYNTKTAMINPMHIVANSKFFVDVLKFFNMHIENGSILHLKKRETPMNVSLGINQKLNSLLKSSYVTKVIGLRAEPKVLVTTTDIPWQMSSHVEFEINNIPPFT